MRGDSDFGGIEDGSNFDHEAIVFDARANDAFELLIRGNKFYHDGIAENALAIWERVISDFPNTPAWYMATLNSGRVLQCARQHRAAIRKLLPLLEDESYSELGKAQTLAHEARYAIGEEAGNAAPIVFTPLEDYLHAGNMDWHAACIMISECYEALGNIESARHYAIVARDKFPYHERCWGANSRKLEILLERLEIPAKVAALDEFTY
ncbi:MAG: hypothetical protein WD648_06920 [Planctomycetaceae bacterium]